MLVLIFRVAEVAYGVGVKRVIEVVPRVALREIPHAPSFLVGLLRYRGGAVPVVDLGLLIDGKACADRLDTRIILVDGGVHGGSGPGYLGLIAERVEADPLGQEPLDHARRRLVHAGNGSPSAVVAIDSLVRIFAGSTSWSKPSSVS